jgi:hypothetical protein
MSVIQVDIWLRLHLAAFTLRRPGIVLLPFMRPQLRLPIMLRTLRYRRAHTILQAFT